MNYFHKENELKLDILHSLARSQRALSSIMESIAENAANKQTADHLMQHIEALAKHQMALSAKMAGMKPQAVYRSLPGKPWINPETIHPRTPRKRSAIKRDST